jgi:hypothetical protein
MMTGFLATPGIADLHTAIYTDVRVEVEEAIKGAVGPEVIFRITGGEVGEIGM